MPVFFLTGLGGPAEVGPGEIDWGGAITGSAEFSATSAPAVTTTVLFVAQSAPDYITAGVGFTAQGLPLDSVGTRRDKTIYTSSVTGLPGPVLSWDYSHNGDAEELSVVVVGLFGLSNPTATLAAQARTSAGALIAALPARSFSTFGQEPQEDIGGNRTTFQFKESFDRDLRGTLLPELIPWKDNPTPDPCLTVRQRVSVNGIVTAALAGMNVTLAEDPLAEAYFEEGRYDFSTLNLTPQAVWDATYGALGMVLQATDGTGGRRLIGRFPNPTSTASGPVISHDWVTALSQGRELLQTPSLLTVRGGDFVTSLDPALIITALGADPAVGEVTRELLPEQEWIEPIESAGTARTQRGYKKSRGQPVSSIEITTDDIEVRETVDGEPYFRQWNGVATGYKLSRTVYDPLCPGRPVLQVTESKSWAFDAQTVGGTFLTYGPGLYRTLSVGDLAADETTTTTYRYSPQGFLTSRTTNTRRLASLKQVDADAPPEERGPLQAREYIKTTQTEQWQAIGGGRWMYTPGVNGQTLLAVYDADSGEAVRTASVARAAPDPPRVTDQAPPSYDCAGACALKEIRDPTGLILKSGDAGFADPQEINLAFMPPAALLDVGRAVLSNNWGRVVSSLTVPLPLGYFPGSWVSSGQVRELRVSQSEGSAVVTTTLTTVRPDNLLGSPNSAAVLNYAPDLNTGRAVMLAGRPGGALARVVTGWDATLNRPIAENAFIAFRTGFPPRPGDEIEWQLIQGRREAINAR